MKPVAERRKGVQSSPWRKELKTRPALTFKQGKKMAMRQRGKLRKERKPMPEGLTRKNRISRKKRGKFRKQGRRCVAWGKASTTLVRKGKENIDYDCSAVQRPASAGEQKPEILCFKRLLKKKRSKSVNRTHKVIKTTIFEKGHEGRRDEKKDWPKRQIGRSEGGSAKPLGEHSSKGNANHS